MIETLFDNGIDLSNRLQQITSIVQNPYLPSDVDPIQFHQDINQLIIDIRKWETSVTNHYRNMSDKEKEQIKELKNLYH